MSLDLQNITTSINNSTQMQGKHTKQGICRSCCFKLINDITEDPLVSWCHSLNWHTWHKYCVWSHLVVGKYMTEVGRRYRTLKPLLFLEDLKFITHCDRSLSCQFYFLKQTLLSDAVEELQEIKCVFWWWDTIWIFNILWHDLRKSVRCSDTIKVEVAWMWHRL